MDKTASLASGLRDELLPARAQARKNWSRTLGEQEESKVGPDKGQQRGWSKSQGVLHLRLPRVGASLPQCPVSLHLGDCLCPNLHQGVSCQVVTAWLAAALQARDGRHFSNWPVPLGRGFSVTPLLSAETLMVLGVALDPFGLRDSGVGSGGVAQQVWGLTV